jgi:TetR/AcrR family transcriptional repressor of nem operon
MTETREMIIEVASQLFLQSNYDGVSIQDIARAVGMTKGALYHHFTSKEQLFEEVATSLVQSAHIDFSILPHDSLRGFYKTLIAHIQTQDHRSQKLGPHQIEPGINFYNLLWDAARLLPGFRASMESFSNLEHAAWTEAIKAAMKRGEIRRGLNANKIAKVFTCVPDGVGITTMLKGGPPSIYGQILELWEALYESLKP